MRAINAWIIEEGNWFFKSEIHTSNLIFILIEFNELDPHSKPNIKSHVITHVEFNFDGVKEWTDLQSKLTSFKILSFASNEILCWNAIYEIQYYLQKVQAHIANGIVRYNEFMQIAWLNLYEFHKIPYAWETLKLLTPFQWFYWFAILWKGIFLTGFLLSYSISFNMNAPMSLERARRNL